MYSHFVACTRSEILDYTNRLSKYGQEIADKKRPNAFTFEIWDFMQNAKRSSCKLDNNVQIDSSTNQMSKDDDIETEPNKNIDETQVLSDDDDGELFNWQVFSVVTAWLIRKFLIEIVF